MTRRTRNAIFYALLCVFFLLGIGVVFYAQGWRMDIFTGQIQKVGAIYVRSFPGDAHIFLNNKPIANQSWLLSRGTLIAYLFPRTYHLTLTEPGYLDWHEDPAVAPSLVTAFNYAVLVPAAPARTGTTTIKNFFAAAGGTVTQTAAGAIMLNGTAIGHGALMSAGADLSDIIFRSSVTGDYIFYDAAAATSTDLSVLLSENNIPAGSITSLTIDPYDATTIVGMTSNEVFIFDASAATVPFVGRMAEGTAAPALSPSAMVWISQVTSAQTGTIALYNIFSNEVVTSSIPLAGAPRALAWAGNNDFGMLQTNGSLFIYDADTRRIQTLADDVKDFAATGDGSAIAALEHNSVEIFPFTDALTYHRFNIPNVAQAERVIWYKDMDHLFVVYPDHVSFLDLDDLSLQNFAMVGAGTLPLYRPQENVLFLLNSLGKLRQFDFPS